jgi:hypothetical protein
MSDLTRIHQIFEALDTSWPNFAIYSAASLLEAARSQIANGSI